MIQIMYANAREFLEGLRLVSYSQAVVALCRLRVNIDAVRVIKRVGLDQDDKMKTLENLWGPVERYVENAIVVLADRFGIDSDHIIQNYMEDASLFLAPYPLGMNTFSDDDFGELLYDTNLFSVEIGPEAFALYLYLSNAGDVDCLMWDEASAHFGWGVGCDDVFTDENQLGEISVDRLRKALEQAGMAEFASLLDFASISDNVFFNHNPYHDDVMQFSEETIKALDEEWKAAQLIQADYEVAAEKMRQDPIYYQRFLEIWQAEIKRAAEENRARVRA